MRVSAGEGDLGVLANARRQRHAMRAEQGKGRCGADNIATSLLGHAPYHHLLALSSPMFSSSSPLIPPPPPPPAALQRHRYVYLLSPVILLPPSLFLHHRWMVWLFLNLRWELIK